MSQSEYDVPDLKAKWTGFEFDVIEFQPDPSEMVNFAKACGESDPRYLDTGNDDFQAVPNFTTKYHGRKAMPDGFPIKMTRSFDAGKSVEVHAPLRQGDTVTAKSEIFDIFEKTGRSGGMLFVVHRMRFTNQKDELISIVDWRMVQKSAPRKEG